MSVLIAKRLVAFVLTLLATSLVVFTVMRVLPGDPAAIILGTGAREDTLLALRQQMGLDRSFVAQYLAWTGGVLIGDFGTSYTYAVPVSQLVAERLSVSLPLAVFAILLSTAIAIPCGVVAASRRGRAGDLGISAAAQLGVAVPNFWLAMLLVLVFAVGMGIFPAGGFPGWEAGLRPSLKALVLPSVALALPQAAILTRVTRSAVLETLGEDHVRTARAKGLTRRAALWRHAVPNALIPVVTILGLQFSFLLAGTIVIENVFYLPGIGRLLFQAIAQRDLIVVQSLVVLIAAAVVVVNFLVDLAYLAIDPRLRTGSGDVD
ncbi:ABC transporter permease [Lutibaculum baratangense]|uniref:Dipeptide transport system permease protein DppB n=1 Tax=Lutibaculum baratangense AMV1 TaxID=631454 RepID=V4RGU7_9HYPH|nr:ABC transporter permease [Lutibaculum baratangense]ESR24594.1 Dipeptide transport system permease protein DppB [Lutibaculum baratangense AMV1]